MAKVAAQYPERSRRDHALRRRAVPARAAPRHARRQRAEHQAPARRARIGAEDRSEASRRLPSLRARHRIHGAARARRSVRGVSRQDHSRRQPHQPHAVAHLERSRTLGRFGRGQYRGVALGPEGRCRRRLRDLSRSQPAHAALRRVDGRPGRAARSRPARITPSGPATRCITR